MLLRKTAWYWKSGLAAISFVLILSISGCSDVPLEEDTVSETVIDIQAIPEESQEDAEEIINICIDLYEKAAEEHTALQVQPLDETYRELSRKYLRPIGFEQNSMFPMLQMTTWRSVQFIRFQKRNLKALL